MEPLRQRLLDTGEYVERLPALQGYSTLPEISQFEVSAEELKNEARFPHNQRLVLVEAEDVRVWQYTRAPDRCSICLNSLSFACAACSDMDATSKFDKDWRECGFVTAGCQHIFHAHCLSAIRDSMCPLCRRPLTDVAKTKY